MANFDIYSTITDRIISELESGVIPWDRPWTGCADGAFSGTTGRPYSLLNQLMLRKPGAWFTWPEIQRRGGHVKKGEKASFVVFWKQVAVNDQDPATGKTKKKLVPMLRYFNVFHVDQVEGLKLDAPPAPAGVKESPSAMKIIAEYIAKNAPLRLENEGLSDKAYYSPIQDKIVVPTMKQFTDQAEYYSTVFHEMTHSTGHKSRLNRLSATAHFGDENYSREELVAELGAAALCNISGVETKKQFRNSAAYIQGWLRALRNDKTMIVKAAGAAAKAVDFILDRPAPDFA